MTDTSQLTVFTVHLQVRSGFEEEFLKASQLNQAGARIEPGNQRFDIYRSVDDGRRFLFLEAYDSADAIAKHRETPHFKTWVETAVPMLAQPRERVPGHTVPEGYEQVS